MKYLEEEYKKGIREDDPMPPVQPYHYGSHYSNSGTVLHFLVRMPPFTKMFLAYQGESLEAAACRAPAEPLVSVVDLLSAVCHSEALLSSSSSSLTSTRPPRSSSSPLPVNLPL